MDANKLMDGLIMFLGLVVLLTFHEFGHAWMALKCGDDTAKQQGRVSLNPMVHIDLLGTVIVPLVSILLSAGGSNLGRFLIGWAKPVPVTLGNLRNPRLDDILVTLAGPWMNLLLAVVLMGLARAGMTMNSPGMTDVCAGLARLSLMLFFFNLLPIPPLDGSQVVRSLLNISYETYLKVSRIGPFILILVIQIPSVQNTLRTFTTRSWAIIGGWFGVPLPVS